MQAMMLRDRNTKVKSAVALLIDQATNGEMQQEANWSLFMHICDHINRSHDEGAKDAAKAIRKRLGCKVTADICLTLKLLETCVKNCGRLFHVHVATSKFMHELIKVINPKYHPPQGMQNTVLGLIQAWAHAFKAVPELREFNKTYQDLKLKGVEFPPFDPELAVIVKQSSAKVSEAAPVRSVAAPPHVQSQNVTASKLAAELAAVRNNCRVFGEMLTEMKPGQDSASDIELLEDLNTTCRHMQKRIAELIETAQYEQHTEELLMVNDDLNNAFLRYDRFQRMRSQHPSHPEPFHLEPTTYGVPSSAPQAAPADSVYDNSSTYDNMLIDIGPTSTATSSFPPPYPPAAASSGLPQQTFPTPELEALSIYDSASSSGFDPFVVSTQHPWQQPISAAGLPPTYATSGITPVVTDKDSDFEEMEKWLKANPRATVVESNDGVTDEFEQFLSSRAREVELLPSVEHQPAAATMASSNANQLDQLFSL